MKKGIGFEQVDNAFVQLDDPAATQRIADRFAQLPWPKILERMARQVNPLLADELKGLSHYWAIDQAEYATDILFASKSALAGLFARLLEFALLTFSPQKIFQYLGRRWHARFDGEVQTRYKSVREPGACIKHFMKRNWLKMYDKLGRMLRVETVINEPGEFKVFRECRHRDGTTSTGWLAMCKGIGNLHHDQRQAAACNHRYLEALSAVEDPTPSVDGLRTLTERCRRQGRSSAGFNPARAEEAKLFAAVLAGDHIARGFCTRRADGIVRGDARLRSAAAERGGGPAVETLARPRLGGEGAALATLARDGGGPRHLERRAENVSPLHRPSRVTTTFSARNFSATCREAQKTEPTALTQPSALCHLG